MDNQAHENLDYWLDLEVDGELDATERRSLAEALASTPSAGALERRRLERLQDVLNASRVEVRQGFRSQVMSRLEPAGWEARSLRAWRWPVAVMLMLGGLAAALIGRSAAGLAPQSSFLATFGALSELFATSLVTGAGLLSASWRGVGLALGDALRSSPIALAAIGAVVLGLNLLLISMLRRSRRVRGAARVHSPD